MTVYSIYIEYFLKVTDNNSRGTDVDMKIKMENDTSWTKIGSIVCAHAHPYYRRPRKEVCPTRHICHHSAATQFSSRQTTDAQ